MSANLIQLFNGPLSSSYRATQWLAISSREITLDFELACSGGPSTVEYYLEFSNDPSGPAYREIAQEDAGGGVVLMPVVVRTFADNNGTNLADGTHFFDTEYVRRHRLVRVQIRATAGTVRAKVTAPFGLLAR